MAVDTDDTMQKFQNLLTEGSENTALNFIVDHVPPMIDEIKELRNRVMFLELNISSLETELEVERGP